MFDKSKLKLLSRRLRGKRRITAYALINKNNKFLLVQEAGGHIRGLWGLPGGGVKEGETVEQAVVREAEEESGYQVSVIGKVGEYRDRKKASMRIVYTVEIVGGALIVVNSEIMKVDWFNKSQIIDMKGVLRGDWVLKAIGDSETLE